MPKNKSPVCILDVPVDVQKGCPELARGTDLKGQQRDQNGNPGFVFEVRFSFVKAQFEVPF